MSNYLTPQPVVVVEPRHKPAYATVQYLAQFAVGIAFTFLSALVAWWLGPIVFPGAFDLTYWQTFGLLFLLRAIVPRAHSFRYQSNISEALPR